MVGVKGKSELCLEGHSTLRHLSTHEVYYLLNFISYYTLTGSPHI